MKKILIILSLVLFGFFISGDICSADANTFDLTTLFTNDHISEEKGKIQTFEQAIGAVVSAITGILGGFAILGTILGGFMILTSGGSDDGMNKGKKIIGFSLIGIAVSLVSYTLIQLVQMFLFSFK